MKLVQLSEQSTRNYKVLGLYWKLTSQENNVISPYSFQHNLSLKSNETII